MTSTVRNITKALPGPWLITVAALCAFGIAGCNGTSSSAHGTSSSHFVATGTPTPPVTSVDLDIIAMDVNRLPIANAEITVAVGNVQRKATTSANGSASFANLPPGEATFSTSAPGFETQTFTYWLSFAHESLELALSANGAWAIGRAIVLGSRMIELASDGSAMTFSIDVAVIGEHSEALETLTSDDFSIFSIDCGWGGPRDCASDSEGNVTAGDGNFSPDGPAQSFGLQPPLARHPYLVGVLAERSTAVSDWDERAPALKTFFTALGGNDSASLASVKTNNGITTLTVLGPFTSDGRMYLDAIDQLPAPAGDAPQLQESLLEWVRQAAAADSGGMPGVERTVLLMVTPGMTIPEIDEAAALARQLGVHISAVIVGENYGIPETAVRSGGFVARVDDPRQLSIIFGAMDQLLAGTMRYYRMQYRIKGNPGTFVSGGNAKVRMKIHVPTSIINMGVYVGFDVTIP